jgi:hypothetical protein
MMSVRLPVLGVLALCAACNGALAQPAGDAPAVRTAPVKPGPAPKSDPFAVTNWFEIPAATNIAPGAELRGRKLDFLAREDANNINVYGRKQKFEPRTWSREGLDEPWVSAAAPSVDMPVRQNSSCEGAAYNTVGGQPGTGRDLIGALGAGSGC